MLKGRAQVRLASILLVCCFAILMRGCSYKPIEPELAVSAFPFVVLHEWKVNQSQRMVSCVVENQSPYYFKQVRLPLSVDYKFTWKGKNEKFGGIGFNLYLVPIRDLKSGEKRAISVNINPGFGIGELNGPLVVEHRGLNNFPEDRIVGDTVGRIEKRRL